LQSLPADLGFRKSKKLKTDDISSVFNFRHQENGEFLRFLFKPNQLLAARLAVIVSRKIARHAVERNYCKRIVRELFRVRQYQAGSIELVVQIRKKFTPLQFNKVAGEFDLLLNRIAKRY
jgi:ribonuclease P protein component